MSDDLWNIHLWYLIPMRFLVGVCGFRTIWNIILVWNNIWPTIDIQNSICCPRKAIFWDSFILIPPEIAVNKGDQMTFHHTLVLFTDYFFFTFFASTRICIVVRIVCGWVTEKIKDFSKTINKYFNFRERHFSVWIF